MYKLGFLTGTYVKEKQSVWGLVLSAVSGIHWGSRKIFPMEKGYYCI